MPVDAPTRALGEDVVQRAAAILLGERAAAGPRAAPAALPLAMSPALPAAPGVDLEALQRQLQERVSGLVDDVVRLVSARSALPLPAGLPFGAAAPTTAAPAADDTDAVPTLRVPGLTAPGTTASVALRLTNDDAARAADVAFAATELLGERGARIPAASVTLTPSATTIAPGGLTTIAVGVRVPPDAAPGAYAGLLVATAGAELRAVLVVRVAGAAGRAT